MSLDVLVYIFIAFMLYFVLAVNAGLFPFLDFKNLQFEKKKYFFPDETGDQVGLAITQALSLITALQFGVKQSNKKTISKKNTMFLNFDGIPDM